MSNILGLNLKSHNTSAALIQNGELIAFVEEERFNREKQSWKFPKKAIEYVLKEGKINDRDIDGVGIGWKSSSHFFRRMCPPYNLTQTLFPHMFYHLKNAISIKKNVADVRSTLNLRADCKIIEVDHHLSHAASAFYVSPYEEAAILSLDGHGEWTTLLVAKGTGNTIKKIDEVFWPKSLGEFYFSFSKYLGFPDYGDEYKMMGLGPYGSPKYIDQVRQILRFDNKKYFSINSKYLKHTLYGPESNIETYSTLFKETFGKIRLPHEKVEDRHCDIAHSVQFVLNEVILDIVEMIYKKLKTPNLCMAGGVALNCVANQHIREKSSFKNIFIQPSSNDAGVGLGAALVLSHGQFKEKRKFIMKNPYFGPAYKESFIQKELDTCQLKYDKLDNIEERVASLLKEGNVIGWFQGRMELGPRALGGRSIIANPMLPDMKNIVNERIKFREEFRPFAPSVLFEKATEYFEIKEKSPFMLFTANVVKSKRGLMPSIEHVDHSARIQTVDETSNPRFRKLIMEFDKQTGVPVILNTSFNVKGEPIVCSPADAIRCFFSTGLDYLVLENFLVYKK